NNGQEAVEACRQRRFDLILMDIQMPISTLSSSLVPDCSLSVDGVAATKELRKSGETLPIVGLTANIDDGARRDALLAGMNDLLTKPISLEALRATLRQARL